MTIKIIPYYDIVWPKKNEKKFRNWCKFSEIMFKCILRCKLHFGNGDFKYLKSTKNNTTKFFRDLKLG